MTKLSLIRNEHDLPWESWDDPELCTFSPVVWKTLISQGQTNSHGLTIGIFEVPPGEVWLKHHHQSVEAYYIIAGRGRMLLGEETHEITAGMAIFIPENTLHETTNIGDEVLKVLYIFPTDSFDDVVYVIAE